MLYVIRHGKTDWNELCKLQGQTNIPLNDDGRKMAREAALEYKDVNFDVCYCSPLDRAYETACILLEGRNVPVIVDERLKEMCFGVYEGVEKVFEKPECPMYNFFINPEKYVAPDGAESFEQLFLRTGNFLRTIALPEVEKGKDVLIVGHGAMNNSIVSQIKNFPIKDFWKTGIPNCKLIQLI